MSKIVKIIGMTCGHCSSRVKSALESLDGISAVSVNLDEKEARLEYTTEVGNEIIIQTVTEVGYEVIEII